MAGGLKHTAEFLCGAGDNLTAYDAYVDSGSEELEEALQQFLAEAGDENVKLLISDIYGGSVNHIFMRYMDWPGTYILTGVNLPMVLELLVNAEEDYNGEKLNQVVSQAQEAIRVVTFEAAEEENNDIF